jgi:hypothetical protein
MTRPALVTMPVSKLIEDLSIYPRRIVNQNHVRDLTSALQAAEGADIFPPLTVDRRSKRIVDGFHRRRAFLAVLGPDAEIQAELRTYHSETELLLDAVRLNCVHGLNLYEIEKRRIVLKLSDLGVDDDEIAGALHVPPVRVQQIKVRVATVVDGDGAVLRLEPLKRPLFHFQGRTMSEAQAAAGTSSPGGSYMQTIRALQDGLRYRLLPTDGRIDAALRTLAALLDNYLEGDEEEGIAASV